jgi:hypothetical protein
MMAQNDASKDISAIEVYPCDMRQKLRRIGIGTAAGFGGYLFGALAGLAVLTLWAGHWPVASYETPGGILLALAQGFLGVQVCRAIAGKLGEVSVAQSASRIMAVLALAAAAAAFLMAAFAGGVAWAVLAYLAFGMPWALSGWMRA